MHRAFTTLGAISASDIKLIVSLIVVVFIVLANIVKAIVKEADGIKKRSAGVRTDAGQINSQSAKDRLDALAARRRDELRRLAQQRPPEPANLTMTQRVERERARTQYQQRAEQLKGYRDPAPQTQPRAAQPAPAPPSPTADPQQAVRDAARRRVTVQAEQARRAAAARRQAGIAAQKRADEQRRAAAAKEKERQPVVLNEVIEPAKPAKPQAPRPATVTAAPRSKWARPSRQTLRDAFIFKEILDPPVALRPPQD